MTTGTRHEFTAAGGKALATVELDDGDLLIEGFAAAFDGRDRVGDAFIDGAFQRGVAAFVSGASAPICFHHRHEQVLGRVLELREVEGNGLWMRGKIDGAIRTHPVLGTIYRQIRSGTLRGLSVGGFFRRVLTPSGYKINNVDLTEVSITGVPTDSRPAFAVVGGKSLEIAALEAAWFAEAERRLDLIGIDLDVAAMRMRAA